MKTLHHFKPRQRVTVDTGELDWDMNPVRRPGRIDFCWEDGTITVHLDQGRKIDVEADKVRDE